MLCQRSPDHRSTIPPRSCRRRDRRTGCRPCTHLHGRPPRSCWPRPPPAAATLAAGEHRRSPRRAPPAGEDRRASWRRGAKKAKTILASRMWGGSNFHTVPGPPDLHLGEGGIINNNKTAISIRTGRTRHEIEPLHIWNTRLHPRTTRTCTMAVGSLSGLFHRPRTRRRMPLVPPCGYGN